MNKMFQPWDSQNPVTKWMNQFGHNFINNYFLKLHEIQQNKFWKVILTGIKVNFKHCVQSKQNNAVFKSQLSSSKVKCNKKYNKKGELSVASNFLR